MYIPKSILVTTPLLLAMSLTACDQISSILPIGDSDEVAVEATTEVNTQPTKKTASAKAATDLATYTVAMNNSYPPFEFIGEDGKLTGFDVDLLNAIAKKENFNVEYKPYTIERIVDVIKNGEEDMSASSIFISDDRKELIDYSNSYFSLHMYVVGIDKPGRPKSISDVVDKKIAVENHFLLDKITKEIFVPQNNDITKVNTNYLAYQMMYTGKVDMMIENIMSVKEHAKYESDKPLFFLELPEESTIKLGYITQKGNDELMNKLNSGIEKVKADGTYDKIYNKWFGETKKITQGAQ